MSQQKTQADAFRLARAAQQRAREAVGAMLPAIYGGDEVEAAGVAFEATRLVVEAANLALALRRLGAGPSRLEADFRLDVFAEADLGGVGSGADYA